MSEASFRQIMAMGTVNTAKLCKNTYSFYRMKEKAGKAIEMGEFHKADIYTQRKSIALAGMRRAAGKIAAKTGACNAKEIEEKIIDLEEYCRPDFRIEARVGAASAIVGATGFITGSEAPIKAGVMGLLVTAMIYLQSFAGFAGIVYSVLEEKVRNAAKGGLEKAETAP